MCRWPRRRTGVVWRSSGSCRSNIRCRRNSFFSCSPLDPLIQRELGSVQRSCRGEVHRLLEELRAREMRTQVGLGDGHGREQRRHFIKASLCEMFEKELASSFKESSPRYKLYRVFLLLRPTIC